MYQLIIFKICEDIKDLKVFFSPVKIKVSL